jgi:hypothetical protein
LAVDNTDNRLIHRPLVVVQWLEMACYPAAWIDFYHCAEVTPAQTMFRNVAIQNYRIEDFESHSTNLETR